MSDSIKTSSVFNENDKSQTLSELKKLFILNDEIYLVIKSIDIDNLLELLKSLNLSNKKIKIISQSFKFNSKLLKNLNHSSSISFFKLNEDIELEKDFFYFVNSTKKENFVVTWLTNSNNNISNNINTRQITDELDKEKFQLGIEALINKSLKIDFINYDEIDDILNQFKTINKKHASPKSSVIEEIFNQTEMGDYDSSSETSSLENLSIQNDYYFEWELEEFEEDVPKRSVGVFNITSTIFSSKALLTANQEIELIKDIQLKKNPNCNKKELQKAKQAESEILLRNLRLIASIATKFKGNGLSFDDLMSEGIRGFLIAISKFELQGHRISTYSTYWINQTIMRAIADQTRIIRLPVHIFDTLKYIKKSEHILVQENLTDEVDEDQLITILETRVDNSINSVEKLRKIRTYNSNIHSLNIEESVFEDEELVFVLPIDLIQDKRLDGPYKYTLKKELEENLRDVFKKYLKPNEIKVLNLKYGLKPEEGEPRVSMTNEEIAKEFNLSKERIRQIEQKALFKLRSKAKIELEYYLKN